MYVKAIHVKESLYTGTKVSNCKVPKAKVLMQNFRIIIILEYWWMNVHHTGITAGKVGANFYCCVTCLPGDQ